VPLAEQTRVAGTFHLIDVLDRILDKGIVIDAEVTLNVAGIAFLRMEARIFVAGFETYLEYADSFALTAPASWRPVSRPSGLPAVVTAGPTAAGASAWRLRDGGEAR
jgi:hypothetical protein